MNLLSWNCHGLGMPFAVRNLKEVILKNKQIVVFLMDTRQEAKKLEVVRNVVFNFLGMWIL